MRSLLTTVFIAVPAMTSLLCTGCAPELRDGIYSCNSNAECPEDWLCDPSSQLCFSNQATGDASVDSPVDGDAGDGCNAIASAVDLLVVVDNSGTMEEEQAQLRQRFPDFVLSLFSGDIDLDGTPDTTGIQDLRAGVVTTDMGTGGHNIATCIDEFGDDGVLQMSSDPGVAQCSTRILPNVIQFDPSNVSMQRDNFGCLASPGIEGCGFEQPLEAALKAVTSSTSSLRFHNDTTGHADGSNTGFLRPDSVLVVVLVTDEDDCSAANPDLFGNVSPFDAVNPNLRCSNDWGLDEPLHLISRYADGLRATRTDPRKLVFAVLGGIPEDIEDEPFDTILGDARMQYRESMGMMRLEASCETAAGRADPGRRLVEAAREIQATGSTAVVSSICASDYSRFVRKLLGAIEPLLTSPCDS